MREVRTVGMLLRRRAEERPEATAYVFLEDGEREGARLTYAALDAKACAVAAELARMGGAGERVLLLFPPGLELVSAFFGCLYAGAIAVPASLPDGSDRGRGLARLAAIAKDCGAGIALTTGKVAELARGMAAETPELAGARWVAVDEIAPREGWWDPPGQGGLAFLQYTSGSTRSPAGVRVTHANLLHNLSYGDRVERNDASSVSVSWLPVHHDMGLIEGTLLPVYGGYPAYQMSPAAFLQRPARWLEAITRYRATNSGGPNFAYELCARKVTGEVREALELSSWRVAYNGSEPIRAETLERFVDAFGPRGFRKRALHPVYGLAEATLIVSGVRVKPEPTVLVMDSGARLVGAGTTACGVEVRVVEPATGEERPDGSVGEIWLRSASVADGYWGRPEETAQAFQARLAEGDGPFLRTGDLGFLHQGELFVAGRLKDLIIVRGRNHYPQDIERTVEGVHAALRPGCSAAFAVSRDGEEQLAVVAEVNADRCEGSLEELGGEIRAEIAREHGIAPAALWLVAPHTVPKTSSGKIQRRACRGLMARGEMEALWRWETPADAGVADRLARASATDAPTRASATDAPMRASAHDAPTRASAHDTPTRAGATDVIDADRAPELDLLSWLQSEVAARLGTSAAAIDPTCPLASHGLGSLDTLALLGALSERTGREIPAEALSEHPDLASLAALAMTPVAGTTSSSAAERRMREDARLDLWPATRPADPSAPYLLTGATGFLGAHLLHDLLRRSTRDAWCLVRASSPDEAHLRIRQALEAHELWSDDFAPRLRGIAADLGLPRLGLPDDEWRSLTRETSEVFHAAAAVNWVYPYEALRAENVEGTRQLLTLACAERSKPLHFISTQLVCYGAGGPRRDVTEEDDFLDEIGGLHLGYAQSKCVAERLVRIAGARGLPIRIYRPPFLLGSSRTARCSTDDFVAALIKGCVQLGSAPDLDWDLDSCPVDFLSALIAEVASGPYAGPSTIHPPLPKPRHWRECVLWMNLYGYRLPLRPYAEWLRELERAATTPDHALFFLRPFFLSRLAAHGGYTRPELYETPFRNTVSASATRAALAERLPECPRLDAPLLERYFRSWAERGFLPRVARARRASAASPGDSIAATIERSLGVPAAFAGACGRDGSITGELTAWKHTRGTGLFRYRLADDRTVVVKAKASAEDVVDVAASVAAQCDPRLGNAVRRHASLLGFDGCHLRELQLYAQPDPRFTAHAPEVLFLDADKARGRWLLGLEDLAGRTWSSERAASWGRAEREAAVRGLAALHAIGYPDGARGWPELPLAPRRTARRMVEGAELWAALEAHARPFFAEWLGESFAAVHRRLVALLDRWWQPMDELPRTLIHGDFNARNIALRRTGAGLRLCAYDWELASEGLPQRDLAELLAFTLEPDAGGEELDHCVELHRRELERHSGLRIDRAEWLLGLTAALGDLLVTRLSLYTMVHRFQRQGFLPDAVRTWGRLYAHFATRPLARRRAMHTLEALEEP